MRFLRFRPHAVYVKRKAIRANRLALTALPARSGEAARTRFLHSAQAAQARRQSGEELAHPAGPKRVRCARFLKKYRKEPASQEAYIKFDIHSEILPFPNAAVIPGNRSLREGPNGN